MPGTERKQFYRTFFAIVMPIAAQQLITAAVTMADTLMLGYVSQTALASSSLAGQVQFVLNMIYFGLGAGITILCAQYWGKGDVHAIELVLSIGLKISCAVGLLFFTGAVFFPEALMRIYTADAAMIKTGAEYLRIVGFSYLFLAISQPYLGALKSMERVKICTVIIGVALGLNILLNAVFIFGWIPGVPPMGIRGVALATVIARAVELTLCVITGERFKLLRLRPRLLLLRSRVLLRDFVRYSLPAIGNEFVWGLAFSTYSIIMGHLGEDIVAANSIVSTLRSLASVLGFGVANGTAIILGKQIGANNMAAAERDSKRLIWLTFLTSVFGSVVILICHPIVLSFMDLTVQAQAYLQVMIWISAVYVVGPTMNTCLICGVFRAGGDSRFGFICDLIFMWGICVPIGFIAAFALNLPPLWVYLILSLDEFVKMPVVFWHYKKKKWLKNITKEVVA